MFIGLGHGRRRMNELYQEIEEKRPNIFRYLKHLKLEFGIPSESSMMFREDVVCILQVRGGLSTRLQEMIHNDELWKSQLRIAPVLGSGGGKRRAPPSPAASLNQLHQISLPDVPCWGTWLAPSNGTSVSKSGYGVSKHQGQSLRMQSIVLHAPRIQVILVKLFVQLFYISNEKWSSTIFF